MAPEPDSASTFSNPDPGKSYGSDSKQFIQACLINKIIHELSKRNKKNLKRIFHCISSTIKQTRNKILQYLFFFFLFVRIRNRQFRMEK